MLYKKKDGIDQFQDRRSLLPTLALQVSQAIGDRYENIGQSMTIDDAVLSCNHNVIKRVRALKREEPESLERRVVGLLPLTARQQLGSIQTTYD